MAITARRWSSTSCGPPNGPPAGAGAVGGDGGDERHAGRRDSSANSGRSMAVVMPRLEVVEQHVVAMLEVREAVDVAVAQLDVALERVAEAREVRRGARLLPGGLAERRRAAGLRGQAGRDPHRLLEVAPQLARSGGRRRRPGPARPPMARARRAAGRARDRSAARGRPSRASPPGRRAPAAPSGGIIVFWSQNSSEWMCPRSARIAARSCSAASSAGRRSPAGARVDGVEQRVHVGEVEVLGEVAGGLLARRALERHVERDEARAGLVVASARRCRRARVRRGLRGIARPATARRPGRRRRPAGGAGRTRPLRAQLVERARERSRPTTAGPRGGGRARPAGDRASPASPRGLPTRSTWSLASRPASSRTAARRPRPPRGSRGPVRRALGERGCARPRGQRLELVRDPPQVLGTAAGS